MGRKGGSYNQFSNESLIEYIVQSDKAAFAELYSRWVIKIKKFFLNLCEYDEDTANDLTQDLFLKILERAGTFDSDQKFSPWVFTIAYNLFKNELRKRKTDEQFRNNTGESDEIFYTGVEKSIDLKSSSKFVQSMLNKLDPAVRSIFILRHVEELTVPEIARITSLPEGTVKSRLFYALKKLSKERQQYQLSEWI
ncbi:MAG: hypothetical protein C0592_10040 [Marinilabiliales bacterium]|nr:MAG: hypothetical protein C0592_10040 [Marinilabiliales bacterium]